MKAYRISKFVEVTGAAPPEYLISGPDPDKMYFSSEDLDLVEYIVEILNEAYETGKQASETLE